MPNLLFCVLCLPGDQSHPFAQPTINHLACCICWSGLLGRAVFPPWNEGPNFGSYSIRELCLQPSPSSDEAAPSALSVSLYSHLHPGLMRIPPSDASDGPKKPGLLPPRVSNEVWCLSPRELPLLGQGHRKPVKTEDFRKIHSLITQYEHSQVSLEEAGRRRSRKVCNKRQWMSTLR